MNTVQQKKPAPLLFLVIFVAAVVGLFFMGYLPRIAEHKELEKMHAETTGALPVVHTVPAQTC